MSLKAHIAKPSGKPYDAIVIGSGITGGWAVKELCEAGLETLMIERGPLLEHRKDYTSESVAPWDQPYRNEVPRDEVARDQPVQKRCYAFNDATRKFFGNDRELPYQTDRDNGFVWIRGNQLGGRSLVWARQCYRWSPYDFAANKRDGHGQDWPLRYRDLESWYSYVERFAGISGTMDGLPQLPDSVCQPPFSMTRPELDFKAAVEAGFPGRRVLMGRVANLTQPTEEQKALGRARCQARDACFRGCSLGAYFSTQSATLPAALKTNRLHLAPRSIVHSLIYDEARGRVRGVRIIDSETLATREYFARVIFLCASTLASTQILLNSGNRRFPNGLANRSGVLGRYLMDHNYNAAVSSRIPGYEEEYYYGRRPTHLYLPNVHYEPKRYAKGFRRGYAVAGFSYRDSWQTSGTADGFGADFKARLGQAGSWRFVLFSMGEMLPNAENQVALHPTLKDRWGMPQLEIECRWSANERVMAEASAEACSEMLKAAGHEDLHVSLHHNPPGLGIHEMGTARMGADPKQSVFNGWNQAHDIPNLFCTDGAVMCSTATQNPSLTYMALTARAVDYAVNELKNQRL
ncbi:MAG: GMC family oxidoreductase [Pseudomonadota bacterium]